MELESVRPRATTEERSRTVDDAADELRERLAIEGARLSYRQNCESMQRIHISPTIGRRRIETVTPALANEWIERTPVVGAARPKRAARATRTQICSS
jgi:hypothetical protein